MTRCHAIYTLIIATVKECGKQASEKEVTVGDRAIYCLNDYPREGFRSTPSTLEVDV